MLQKLKGYILTNFKFKSEQNRKLAQENFPWKLHELKAFKLSGF